MSRPLAPTLGTRLEGAYPVAREQGRELFTDYRQLLFTQKLGNVHHHLHLLLDKFRLVFDHIVTQLKYQAYRGPGHPERASA